MVVGALSLSRPRKPDGSYLEQLKLQALPATVARLLSMGQVTVSSPGRGTALVQFQAVREGFTWQTAADAVWEIFYRADSAAAGSAP